ncbi:MAG: DUF6445 family protein [Pseudomonadota bacterium]
MHCSNLIPQLIESSYFSEQKHKLVRISEFLRAPDTAIEQARLQKFAAITPQYPGIRAGLDRATSDQWLEALSPILTNEFERPIHGWEMQAWFSLVTKPPHALLPIQCLPHVDGTNPTQIALMVYLHHTSHGGTAFFRHKATGLESLTDETFPVYKRQLEKDVAQDGLPPKAYVTDGAPYFERTHKVDAIFNTAVLYRGNIFHSGVIEDAPLSDDPAQGRLTINAFFRAKGSS